MSFKQKLTLFLAMIAIAGQIAHAQGVPPGNVKVVQAKIQNGQLMVLWQPVQGATTYRVYYSHESILGNQGNYDDFVQSVGAATEYTFQTIPLTSPKIYVGVLAVSADGIESEGFEVEASVDAPTSGATASAPAITEPVPNPAPNPGVASSAATMPSSEATNAPTTSVPMAVSTLQVISSTGIVLGFTKDISLNAPLDPTYFLVTDSGGVVLQIEKVQSAGKLVLLTTKPQVAGREYQFTVLRNVPAQDGTNAVANSVPVKFMGMGPVTGTGTNPTPTGTPVRMLGIDLSSAARKDGTYDVTASWTATPGVRNFVIYATVDGKRFERSSTIPATQTSIKYNRVRPGTFGVRITALDAAGIESAPVEKIITLQATALAESGLGLFGIAAAAGAVAGKKFRRKKAA